MDHSYDDTIFSLATAVGRSATAMIRISGSRVRDLSTIFNFDMPEPKVAKLRILAHQKQRLDQSIILFFKGPESYTGEDVIEFHIHGGRAVIESIYKVLINQTGFRLAENGEFSRRAVVNGRIDLTAAEGINDLINAQTEAQRIQGLQQLEGGLRRQLEIWSESIKTYGAHIEAYIDFPDEEIPSDVLTKLVIDIQETGIEMEKFLDDGRKGEILRDGMKVAVIGPPNVGKSSFVNWLTKRDIAITSQEAGTTRDIIEANINLSGYPVIVADTAGLRKSAGNIEAEGIKRARQWAIGAELRLLILDPPNALRASLFSDLLKPNDIIIMNKTDRQTSAKTRNPNWLYMSVKTGDGLSNVLEKITDVALLKMGEHGSVSITQTRHRKLISECIYLLGNARLGLLNKDDLELVAEDIRSANHSIGRITGKVDVEDLLDIVFTDFCIGK
tara:strand:+ start:49 stop:1383 length:1335 start_codon:yes stop_codon:yes gene_type:complete